MQASMDSRRLGSDVVAMPTAILQPLTRGRNRAEDGRPVSCCRSSVRNRPCSCRDRKKLAGEAREAHCVTHRRGGSPPTELKFPWPSMSTSCIENHAMRTGVVDGQPPCGWYLPMTSPTMRADFL